jgi:deoxyribodipyrimidine photo-lyase
MRKVIYWFRNDLRLHDQPVLKTFENKTDILLLPVFCFDERWFVKIKFGFPKTGNFRAKFLIESVNNLKRNLQKIGSDLLIIFGKTEEKLYEIATKINADEIFTEKEDTSEEIFIENQLKKKIKYSHSFSSIKNAINNESVTLSPR